MKSTLRRQTPVNSVGKKLLLSIALPTLALTLVALGFLWLRTAAAMAEATHDEALRLAELQQSVAGNFLQALVIVLLFAVVLVGATAVSLRIFISNPLQKLTMAMKRAEEGDFVVRADEKGNDELARLSQAFNRMLGRITSLKVEEIDNRRDLDEAREELEVTHQLAGRLKELSILYDVARTVTSSIELNEVLQKITDTVPARLGVPKFSIMLITDGALEIRMAHPGGGEGMTFAIGEGVCGHAAATRKSVYVADLESDQQFFRVRGGFGARGRGSLLSLPMLHGEEVLGVLNFERPEKAGFSAAEIEFFTAVADQAAMAVKNARLHEQTVELSITDPLTGVSNRRHLFAQLELEIARANRFGTQLSFLMIDIDYFKKLNDAAGHTAGDTVLRQVCDLMQSSVRRVDTLARYGGEEFVVLLPQVTRAEALEVAEKLRRLVEEAPLEHREAQPDGKITISVGVANLPIDAVEQGQLVDCADSALYASKRSGRNKVTTYAQGMEVHPGRERGPHAQKKRITGEIPVVALKG